MYKRGKCEVFLGMYVHTRNPRKIRSSMYIRQLANAFVRTVLEMLCIELAIHAIIANRSADRVLTLVFDT